MDFNAEEIDADLLAQLMDLPDPLDELYSTSNDVKNNVASYSSSPVQPEKERNKSRREKRSREVSSKHSASSARSRFIADEAESGMEDEEISSEGNEHLTQEETDSELLNNQDWIMKNHKRQTHTFFEGDENMSVEMIAKKIEERMSGLQEAPPPESDFRHCKHATRYTSSLRFASHMLPQPTDPKIFAIKCRPRMARLLVGRLVNKCYLYRIGVNPKHIPVDLGIISVFSIDHVKDHIYVEAHRRIFVEIALSGMNFLFHYRISVVDPIEVMQMLDHTSGQTLLKPGDFVRFQQKIYRGDLAQVVSINESDKRAICKVIPRVDFIGKEYRESKERHPQRFFVPYLAVGAIQLRDNTYRWGDLLFDSNGYLLKTSPLRFLVSGSAMAKPQVEELGNFFKYDVKKIESALPENGLTSPVTDLHVGEMARVINGPLAGSVGRVVDVHRGNGIVQLSCRVPSCDEPLLIRSELVNCQRYFMEGTHVIVQSGPQLGQSGTVVKSSGDMVRIFSDNGEEEFDSHVNECIQRTLQSSACHKLGKWRLFDLVLLTEGQIVSCIVRCNANDVWVLTLDNEVRRVTNSGIQRRLSSQGKCTVDRLENIISPGMEVVVKSGLPQYIGIVGHVEQLHHKILFIRSNFIKENSGVIAISSSCVLVSGGRTKNRQPIVPMKQLPPKRFVKHNATLASIPQSMLQPSQWSVESSCTKE